MRLKDKLLHRIVRVGHRWSKVEGRRPDEGDGEVQSVDLYDVQAGETEPGGGFNRRRSMISAANSWGNVPSPPWCESNLRSRSRSRSKGYAVVAVRPRRRRLPVIFTRRGPLMLKGSTWTRLSLSSECPVKFVCPMRESIASENASQRLTGTR
jgi:hypothetical protein